MKATDHKKEQELGQAGEKELDPEDVAMYGLSKGDRELTRRKISQRLCAKEGSEPLEGGDQDFIVKEKD